MTHISGNFYAPVGVIFVAGIRIAGMPGLGDMEVSNYYVTVIGPLLEKGAKHLDFLGINPVIHGHRLPVLFKLKRPAGKPVLPVGNW